MKITWTIDNLAIVPTDGILTDVVTKASWKCVADDGIRSYETSGLALFQPPNPETFVPFNHLSPEQVLEWCWDNGLKESVESSLVRELEFLSQSRTEVIIPPPWNK